MYLYIISTTRPATRPVTMRKRPRSNSLVCVDNPLSTKAKLSGPMDNSSPKVKYVLSTHLDDLVQMRRSLNTRSPTDQSPTDQSLTSSEDQSPTGQSLSGNSTWQSTFFASICDLESARCSATGVVEWSPTNNARKGWASNPQWDARVWTRN